jgi:hypothetical protein
LRVFKVSLGEVVKSGGGDPEDREEVVGGRRSVGLGSTIVGIEGDGWRGVRGKGGKAGVHFKG